ncbi:MAG: hypothetical protein J6U54_05215 [Clostridiales bacterium]|nr:hypothetical protein [Clostridiales bacterium]
MIKIILAFAAGAAAGCIGTYFFTKKKCEQYIEEEAEELRQYYRTVDERRKEKEEKKEDVLYNSIVDGLKEYTSEETVNEFEQKMAESEHPEDDEALLSDEEYAERRIAELNADINKEPIIIGQDDYESSPTYDKEELLYYVEDDILTDEYGTLVDDRHRLLGEAFIKSGFCENSDDIIYIRNGNVSSDYEITKVYGSFFS